MNYKLKSSASLALLLLSMVAGAQEVWSLERCVKYAQENNLTIKQAAANSEMNWQVASVSELRASLIAFDLAQIRLSQVKITRNGAGFVVAAERTP